MVLLAKFGSFCVWIILEKHKNNFFCFYIIIMYIIQESENETEAIIKLQKCLVIFFQKKLYLHSETQKKQKKKKKKTKKDSEKDM